MRFVHTIAIGAPVERAWEVLADLGHWPEWTPTMRDVRALGDGPPRLGARYRIEQPRLRPAEFTITHWNPPHGFTWESRAVGVRAFATHTLAPTAGGCELTLAVGFRGPLGPILGALLSRLTREYLVLEAEGLRRRAEART
jgi:uncharacterized protein YndB with AHSA1/START domain